MKAVIFFSIPFCAIALPALMITNLKAEGQ